MAQPDGLWLALTSVPSAVSLFARRGRLGQKEKRGPSDGSSCSALGCQAV